MKSVLVEKKDNEPAVMLHRLVILNTELYYEGTKPYVVLVTHEHPNPSTFTGVVVYTENDKFNVGTSHGSFISSSFKRFNGTITLEQ